MGFSIVILVPTIAILYGEYDTNRTSVGVEQMTEFARELVFQAEKIYYQGAPARAIIEAYYPSGVESVYVITRMGNTGEPVYFVRVNMSNSDVSIESESRVPITWVTPASNFEGPHKLLLEMTEPELTNADSDIVEIKEVG